jgi:ATP-binding cassette subfamily B protein
MKRILRFILPYKKKLAFMLIFLLLHIVGTLYIPTLTASIINNGVVKGNIDYILSTGWIMILLAIATVILSIVGTYLSSFLAASLGKEIRIALFKKSQQFSINDFNKYGTASMITRSTSDIIQIQQTFSALIEMLLPAPIMIIVGLILVFSKDKTLGLIIIMAMILILCFALVIGKKAMVKFESLQNILDKINERLRANITGIRVIRAFNRSKYEKSKINGIFTEYANTSISINKIFATAMPIIMTVMNLCTIFIIWVGGVKVSGDSMGIGDIMAVIEYSALILMYLVMAIMVFMMIPRAEISAKRVNEVLDHKVEVHTKKPLIQNSYVKHSPKVEFRNVIFRYEGAEEPVLENINFNVNAGETFAIIGGTGSGKSTIAKLIPRFYEIEKGEILVDGINIKNISQKALRNKIGYVAQKAFLFSGTIADNLKHGKAGASFEDMDKAAEVAQVATFITELEDGYNSYVAQAGNNFSGGQKQRLAIARAIVKKPEIYIFDDSFSALDYKTDVNLRSALKKETKNSAVILVAQRISTILEADKILVLDEGRVVGMGKHKELLENCQVYRQIAESQFSKEELA